VAAVVIGVIVFMALKHHQKASDPAKNLAPARVQPVNSGNTLPLPKR
jgi:hypothetical protein